MAASHTLELIAAPGSLRLILRRAEHVVADRLATPVLACLPVLDELLDEHHLTLADISRYEVTAADTSGPGRLAHVTAQSLAWATGVSVTAPAPRSLSACRP